MKIYCSMIYNGCKIYQLFDLDDKCLDHEDTQGCLKNKKKNEN